jgi:hypothetical protein
VERAAVAEEAPRPQRQDAANDDRRNRGRDNARDNARHNNQRRRSQRDDEFTPVGFGDDIPAFMTIAARA